MGRALADRVQSRGISAVMTLSFSHLCRRKGSAEQAIDRLLEIDSLYLG